MRLSACNEDANDIAIVSSISACMSKTSLLYGLLWYLALKSIYRCRCSLSKNSLILLHTSTCSIKFSGTCTHIDNRSVYVVMNFPLSSPNRIKHVHIKQYSPNPFSLLLLHKNSSLSSCFFIFASPLLIIYSDGISFLSIAYSSVN